MGENTHSKDFPISYSIMKRIYTNNSPSNISFEQQLTTNKLPIKGYSYSLISNC